MSSDQLTLLSIDPGKNGGYALCLGGMKDGTLYNLGTDADFIDHVRELKEKYPNLSAVMENPPPYAGKNIPSSVGFKLGRNVGFLEGVLRANQIPLELVSPKKWQAGLDGLKGATGSARTSLLREHSARLYPSLKPTLKTCDALLLAHQFINHQQR